MFTKSLTLASALAALLATSALAAPMVYIPVGSAGKIEVVDAATGYSIGERLHGLDHTVDGSALLVAERDGDNVARVNLGTEAVSKQPMGPSPYHMTTITGTGLAYVSSSDEAVMKIIRQDDLSQVSEIAIGDVGHQMVVMP